VFIQQFNGKPQLAEQVEAFLKPELLASKGTIALVVDSDTDPEGTGRKYAALLSRLSNQTVSPQTWTNGLPRVGLFVVPGPASQGEVETLAWSGWASAMPNAAAKTCIDDFISCMAKAGMKPKSPDKARIGALLAIKNDDDPRLGPGARANVFDFTRPEFEPLLRFLGEIPLG
jgi:hypothetical protein